MNKNRYTFWMAAAMMFALLFANDLMAQRGRYSRGHYRGYYSRYVPVRPYFTSRPFVSISFGGIPYRYQSGYFYRPYGTSVRVVIPPVGIVINSLPMGYRRLHVGPNMYYYYNGVYYRPGPGRGYQVVDPPMGAELSQLPPGSKVTMIDGQKYYEHNGTFYEESLNERNEVVYLVVGTDGVLNTTIDELPEEAEAPVVAKPEQPSTPIAPANAGPQIGDKLDNLPTGSTTVVIRNETLYLSPSGFYYRQITESGKTLYEVVGK